MEYTKEIPDCFIYVMDNGLHRKVGISKHPKKRVKSLSTGSSRPITLIYAEIFTKKKCLKIERSVHRTFKHHRTNGEWFDVSGSEIIEEIEYILWEMEEAGII